ncbi:UNVERIFIED_CONTAM: hypothetical protein RMT77_006884 [Armadillidium vulgare]|nr:Brix domain-containing protein [Armadillidium vulgare]
MADFSIKRQARLRREFLYRKSLEDRYARMQKKKDTIKSSIQEGNEIPNHLKKRAISLMENGEWDDEGPRLAAELGGEVNDIDDEYRWAGVNDPKIVLTTSRDPSSKLKAFAKEIKLLFPNCQRINRGGNETKQLIEACRANDVTDFIIVHETRGRPDGLIICHLPFGPTSYFNLNDVVMRHDIPDIGTMSEQYPHLLFNNFKTTLAERTMNVLKYLFPVPKPSSTRVVSFTNYDDWILFRQHMYKKVDGGKTYELSEIGPRFSMQLFKIIRGTYEQENSAEIEFELKPYKNTQRKRTLFSSDDPW